jgi:hypothetical protein
MMIRGTSRGEVEKVEWHGKRVASLRVTRHGCRGDLSMTMSLVDVHCGPSQFLTTSSPACGGEPRLLMHVETCRCSCSRQ